MMYLHQFCPEIAAAATRCFLVGPEEEEIPAGEYACLELYCEDRSCDCRRALLQICRMENNRPGPPLVTISYGWETPEFYLRKWVKQTRADPADPETIRMAEELAGCSVDTFASEPAPEGYALADLVEEMMIADPEFAARIPEHSAVFRERVRTRRGPGWHVQSKMKRRL